MPDLIRHPEGNDKNWIPAFAGMTIVASKWHEYNVK